MIWRSPKIACPVCKRKMPRLEAERFRDWEMCLCTCLRFSFEWALVGKSVLVKWIEITNSADEDYIFENGFVCQREWTQEGASSVFAIDWTDRSIAEFFACAIDPRKFSLV